MPKIASSRYDLIRDLTKAIEALEKGMPERIAGAVRAALEKTLGVNVSGRGGTKKFHESGRRGAISHPEVAQRAREERRRLRRTASSGSPFPHGYGLPEEAQEMFPSDYLLPPEDVEPPPSPPSDGGGQGVLVPPEAPMFGGMGMMGIMQKVIKMLIESIQKLVENFYELAEASGAPFAGWTRPMEETAFAVAKGDKAPHEMIIALFDALTNLMKKVIQFAGIPKLFNMFSAIMGLITNPAFEIFTKILKSLGGIFAALLSPLEPLFVLLEVVADVLKMALAPVLQEIGEEIGPIIQNMLAEIEDFDIGNMEDLITGVRKLGEALVVMIGKILSEPEALMNMFIDMVNFFTAMAGIAPSLITKMIEFMKIFMGTDEQGVTLLERIAVSAINLASTIAENADTLFKFIDKLIKLTDFASDVAGGVMGFWENLGNFFGSWQPFGLGTAPLEPGEKLQHGGTISATGWHMLHEGEKVITKERVERDDLALLRSMEENAKYSKKLYQLLERNGRFLF